MMHSFVVPPQFNPLGKTAGHGKLMRRISITAAMVYDIASDEPQSLISADCVYASSHPAKNQVFRSGWHATYSMWSCCQI